MLAAARSRLKDAQNEDLDPDSRFDLAYGAAHRLALAALRREGYRSDNRITVFQTLVHTIGTGAADVQIFLKAHNERNLAEYQGRMEIDETLLADLTPRHQDHRGGRCQARSASRKLNAGTDLRSLSASFG